MEIILRAVFEGFWNTTSGPNVPIFVRFKNNWDKIDQSNYKSGMEDETVARVLTKDRAEIVTFINNCLQVKYLLYFIKIFKIITSSLQLFGSFRRLNLEMIIENCYYYL